MDDVDPGVSPTMACTGVSASVSIIIATCDRANDLRRTLEAISRVDVPAGVSCEMLVVDNGTGPETAAVVKSCRLPMALRYLHEARRGKSNALNTGLANAAGEIIVLTDDDVVQPTDWLARICAPILNGKADAVAGGVKIPRHLNMLWMNKHHRSWLGSTEGIDPADPSRMVGANMAFSRAVLEKVPGFDPELGPGALGYGEETLFTFQLREAGYRVVAVFDPPVEHHFDAKRLDRKGWMTAAKRMGQVEAYIAHHWEHSVWTGSRRIAVKALLSLNLWRLQTFCKPRAARVMPNEVMDAARALHAHLFYLREKRKPRHYQKGGLVKLVDENPGPSAAVNSRLQMEIQ